MKLQRVLETCLYAEDLERAAAFYRDVLGLDAFAREEGRHVFFRCGPHQVFLLFNPRETDDEPDSDIPPHGCHGAGHVAFAVRDADLPTWRRRLAEHGVAIERDIDWGPGHSLFFRDPAGNSVELATPRIWGIEE